MSRSPEQRQEAQALRAQGLLLREIAEEIGVPKATVTRWLNPEFEKRERAKAKKRKYAKHRKCKSCGKRISNTSVLCLACYKASQRYWTRERLIDAVKEFAAENGYAPRAQDWYRSGPGHPAFSSVREGDNRPFRRFSELLVAAGFTPGQRRGPRKNRKLTTLQRAERAALRREKREKMLKQAIQQEEGER